MKKLKVIVSALLVVVSIFAFTACGTFDGNFKEEATEEQLTQIKTAAGSSYSEKIEEEDGHGWIYKLKVEDKTTANGKTETNKMNGNVQIGTNADGKLELAMKLSANAGGKKFNIETYRKDGDIYLKVGDGMGKFSPASSAIGGALGIDLDLSMYDKMIEGLTQLCGPMYIGMYADKVAALTVEGSASLEAAGIKAYVDNSGDTFKIKYAFNTDAIKDSIQEKDLKFNGNATMDVIVVFNKDLSELKGIQFEIKYDCEYTDGDGVKTTSKSKLVASVEANAKAVKFPNLSKYGDLNGEQIGKMFDSITELMSGDNQ